MELIYLSFLAEDDEWWQFPSSFFFWGGGLLWLVETLLMKVDGPVGCGYMTFDDQDALIFPEELEWVVL